MRDSTKSTNDSELLYWPIDDGTQPVDGKGRSYLRNDLRVIPAERNLTITSARF